MEKLATYIVREGALDPADAVGWVVRLCLSLNVLHRIGAAHGRISAKALQVLGPNCTAAGFFLDTPDLLDDPTHQSPERLDGAPQSPADDTWAAGVLLYHALTGKLPFPGPEAVVVRARVAAPPVPLSVHGIADEGLQQVIDGVLSPAPGSRIRSTSELRLRLLAHSPSCDGLVELKLGRPDIAIFDDEASADDEEGVKLTGIMSQDEAARAVQDAMAKRLAAQGQATAASPGASSPSPVAAPRGRESDVPPELASATVRAEPQTQVLREFPPVGGDALAGGRPPEPAAKAAPEGRRAGCSPLLFLLVAMLAAGASAWLVIRYQHLLPWQPDPSPSASSSAAPPASASAPAGSAIPSSSASSAAVPGTSSAKAAAPTDLVACMLPLFAEDAFVDVRPRFDFLCTERDPREGGNSIRVEVIRAGGKVVTNGMREWSRLGWYEMAAFAVMRRQCCADAPPLLSSVPPRLCPLDQALAEVGEAAMGADDKALNKALKAYRSAVICVVRKGMGGTFGQRRLPSPGAASVFRKTLARMRAAKAGKPPGR